MKNQRTPNFGETFKNVRKGRNISQEKLSSRSSIPRYYICLLENDKKHPGLGTVFCFANGLSMKASELVMEYENAH